MPRCESNCRRWDTSKARELNQGTSVRLKPHSSDFVVHDGHAFGFDGRILACIDLEDGERKWKGGRYVGRGDPRPVH